MILHVDTATEWRGGQQQLAFLLSGRPEDRWAGVPGSPLAERTRPPDVALLPGNDPRNILRLRAAKASLIAAHTSHAHSLALWAGRPLVVHRRVDFLIKSPRKYRRADHIIAVSAGVKDVLVFGGVSANRVTVVYDGVPLRPRAAPTVDLPRPLYGAIGALVPHKGHRYLIEAMVKVPGALFIAGEGPLRAALEEQVQRLGLGDRVFFLGFREDVGGLLASVDAFVHPSIEEGFGQVLLEALGAGCRVVATTAGGIPEAVGDAGILTRPADPAALATAMRAVLSRPQGEGIAVAGRYGVERMVMETGAVYRALLRT